jgi:hypothetical protein
MRAAATAVTALGLAAVATGTAVAVGGRAGPRSEPSGVTGRVIPCGLVHERAARCARAHTPVTVIVRRRDDVVNTARTRVGGHFRIPLAPGRYTLEPRTPGPPPARAVPRVGVVVPDGHWTVVTLPAGSVAPPAPRASSSTR